MLGLAAWLALGCVCGSELPQSLAARFTSVGVRVSQLHSLRVEELRHTDTRAKVILLVPEYETVEKGFAVSFRTPVNDSSGVAHIIEHAVLSGSRKYQTRFPLHHFSRASMATFVNAMTYSDKTVYPVATINTEDLFNLASVYLDAVFDPLAISDRLAFEREGWHVEKESAEEPVKFQGIVFNEMKGSFSDPKHILYSTAMKHLLPDTNYQHSSGGHPPDIVSLSYERFLDFYYHHYHPSNAIVYYFGRAEKLDRLLRLTDEYLTLAADRYDRLFNTRRPDLAPTTQVQTQTRRFVQGPVFVDRPGPPDEADPKNMLMMAVLLGETNSMPICQRLGLDLVSHLLIAKRETPLYQTLLASKLGTHVSAYGIYDHGPHMLFSVGLSGVAKTEQGTAKQKFDRIVMEELRKRSEIGFDPAATKAALNRFEFSIRESVANVANRPMTFLDVVLDEWNYDRDPLRGFDIDQDLQCLRDNIRTDSTYLQKLIKQFFFNGNNNQTEANREAATATEVATATEEATATEVAIATATDVAAASVQENQHRVIVQLVSDKNFDEDRDREERRKLEKIEQSLSDEEIQNLIEHTRIMKIKKAEPESKEALAAMPVLPLSAVKKEASVFPTEVRQYSEIPVVVHPLPTAGIAYTDLVVDLWPLTLPELTLQQLAHHLVLHGNRTSLTAQELSSLLERETGGVSISLEINHYHKVGMVGDPAEGSAFLSLDWRCLNENMEPCAGAVATALFNPDFELNQNVAQQWLKETISKKETRALSSPSHYAKRKFDSHLSVVGRLAEMTDGLSAVAPLRALQTRVESDWPTVAAEMTDLWKRVFHPSRVAVNIGADEDTLEKAQAAVAATILEPLLTRVDGQLSDTPSFSLTDGLIYHDPVWAMDVRFKLPREDVSIVFDLPSMVAYNYLGGHLYQPRTPIQYKHLVPAKILSLDFVFPQIRFVGGGYGASFAVKLAEGKYVFSSYRDPQIAQTYQTLLRASDEMQRIAANVTQADIDQYIVRAISQLDQPKSPSQVSNVAFLRWLYRDSPEHQQIVRDELFDVQPKDFQEFATRLQDAFQTQPKIAVTFGNMKGSNSLDVEGLTPFQIRKVI